MGKFKALITLGAITSLVSIALLFKNKKMKNYVLIGLGSLVIGVLLGFILDKPKTEFLAGEVKTVMMDTCLESKLLCTLTTKDSMSIYRYIREGLKSKSEKVVPQIEEVKEPIPEEIVKPLMERKYTKHLNNGNTEVWDTLIVLGQIKDWKRASKINEVVEVQEKTTTTTAVVSEGKDDSKEEITKYLPVEGAKSKGAYLGLSGGMLYTNKVSYQAGINITGERLGLTLYTTPTPKEWKHFGIQLNTKLVKLKK